MTLGCSQNLNYDDIISLLFQLCHVMYPFIGLLFKCDCCLSICLFSTFVFVYPYLLLYDSLCGLVVRVLGYRSGGPGSIPGTTRFSEEKKKETSSGSGTGSTQPRECN
jgi:hypothetical protein